MTTKLIIKKTVALGLISSSLVRTYLSITDVIFIYPKLILLQNPNDLYLELFKKAIVISSSLFIESIYGFALLIKPTETTKLTHIIFGIALFIFSILLYRLSTLDQIFQNWLFFSIT
ncbi:hypothetical protein KKB06_01335 [Patescibacteria group bacterium]|nr:hypothetical protein [Patescibacteria group bacterium]